MSRCCQALMVEIGFFLFFLPYTVAYNWCYDWLRAKRFQNVASREMKKQS